MGMLNDGQPPGPVMGLDMGPDMGPDIGPCWPIPDDPGCIMMGAGGNRLKSSDRASSCRYIGSSSYSVRLYGMER